MRTQRQKINLCLEKIMLQAEKIDKTMANMNYSRGHASLKLGKKSFVVNGDKELKALYSDRNGNYYQISIEKIQYSGRIKHADK